MKKQHLLILSLSSMLLLGGLSLFKHHVEQYDPEIGKDNADYEEHLVVDYNNPSFVSNQSQATEEYPKKVTINYHNDSGGNQDRCFYFWFSGINGEEYTPDSVSIDGKDMSISLDFTTSEYSRFYKRNMFMIIKSVGTWSGKSDDTPIDFSKFTIDNNGHMEIFVIPGEGSALELYDTKEETTADRILYATFTDWKTIEVISTIKPQSLKLYAFTKSYTNTDENSQKMMKPNCLLKEVEVGSTEPVVYNGLNAVKFYFKLNYYIKINVQYELDGIFSTNPGVTKIKYVSFDSLYDTARFKQYYNYSGTDLGATHSQNQTTFKVWAPTASSVRLFLYKNGTPSNIPGGDDAHSGYDMVFEPGGIWTVTITNKDLHGTYYTYSVINSLGRNEVVDPYAKACGVNGDRGMVCAFSRTNPSGWNNVPTKWDGVEGYDIASPNELSVYEIHIRDLTMHETWSGSSKRGTYSAFAESGTTYQGVTTGFDHIEEMGVKAIQILPFFDQDNDEVDMSFNWGYNPKNYNCLEGGYATDPLSGTSRIFEFKKLVKAYAENANHTRVIMDVVYNHVNSAPESCFNKLMPKYYFRYAEDGSYYNGSGCGNEVKTEAPMMRKYIVESLCWWASEYKIKGFRFDLMGLIDVETLKQAATELYKIDPDIVMYGEGWRGDSDGFHGKDAISAETGNVYSQLYATNERVAVGGFNDAGRNALRGGNDQGWGSSSHLPGYGYASQGASDASVENRNTIADMLWGIHTGKGGNPIQTVNYASCHDNWTLFDQLYYTLGNSGSAPATKRVMDTSTACHVFVMASNGIAFMQGGEELFRSKTIDPEILEDITEDTYEKMYNKYVSHNSYDSPDSVNQFDWSRKVSIEGISTTPYLKAFKDAIKFHNESPKYAYQDNNFPYSQTSAGNPINNISWSGSEKGSSSPQTYHGCAGFQLDEYFIFFAGRNWGWIQFGDVPKSTKVLEFGPNEFDNANGTVNVGDYASDAGGAIVIYKRGN